ncbi:MAG: SDR family oxidoreductase [Chloroflexi bacterium]|nr:MAG: SDR family oxidoreductase [Chloroflexota bacterium]RLT33366.1 MAG: SDR family oxidoreductase [Chloroflexota bacterium]
MQTPKTAIVTGAGSGIGRAASLALCAAGWNVVLAGRNADRLHAVARDAVTPAQMLVMPTDVTKPVQVRALFDAAVAQYGRVDLLFNNAGRGAPAVPIDELDIDDWKATVDVNLNGMFYCLQHAFRVMKAQTPQGGRIINNGSISATTPRPHSIAYTATKHAVTGLTKTAALDGRAYRIAVGQIDIGNAATDMAERMGSGIMQAHGAVVAEPLMDVAHVGTAIVQMAELPLSANVLFQTIMATNMPFVGRG